MGYGYDIRDLNMRIALGLKNKTITPYLSNLFVQGHKAEEKNKANCRTTYRRAAQSIIRYEYYRWY